MAININDIIIEKHENSVAHQIIYTFSKIVVWKSEGKPDKKERETIYELSVAPLQSAKIEAVLHVLLNGTPPKTTEPPKKTPKYYNPADDDTEENEDDDF